MSAIALAEKFLNATPVGRPDALVHRERLPQVPRGPGGVVAQQAVPDSFQGPRLLDGRAEFARDGQRLAVVSARLLGGNGWSS
jgi:hypothetical protein